MRLVFAALILLQSPILFIAFIAAGTDGKLESLVKVWSVTIPIAICSAILLFRIVLGYEWRGYDWLLALVACLPALWVIHGVMFGPRSVRRKRPG